MNEPIDFPQPSGDRESALQLMPKFDPAGLIPCICQEEATGKVLMFAYMNREALSLTMKTGEAHYYSRSRKKIWKKGESSGHIQKVKNLLVDCDQDVVLLIVDTGGAAACHTGYHSCFFRKLAELPGESTGLELAEKEKQFDPDKVYGKNR